MCLRLSAGLLAALVFASPLVWVPRAFAAQTDYITVYGPGTESIYEIGPGDVLRVTVYNSPDPAVEVQVSAAGTIDLPLIGRIQAVGETTASLAQTVEAELRGGGFVRNPQVAVIVTDYRSKAAVVTGLVARPGRYVLERRITRLSELIAQAGGLQENASTRLTVLRRTSQGDQRFVADLASIAAGLAPDFVVQPSDRIFVSLIEQFYIRGAVQRPGQYVVAPRLTVGQAVALGGGVTDRGTTGKVTIYRLINGVRHKYRALLRSWVAPGDEIIVGERLL
jgi:polysaccharide export outer membrane protein